MEDDSYDISASQNLQSLPLFSTPPSPPRQGNLIPYPPKKPPKEMPLITATS
ncbi:hypothetical protein SK128_019315, partial [Halocaridina rubra]